MGTYGKGLQFMFSIPTNIVFGTGSLGTVGTHAKGIGFHRPLIVTDKIMSKSDGVKQLLERLAAVEARLDALPADPGVAPPVLPAKPYPVMLFRVQQPRQSLQADHPGYDTVIATDEASARSLLADGWFMSPLEATAKVEADEAAAVAARAKAVERVNA